MNQTDFSICVCNYKKIKDIIEDIFSQKYPGKIFDYFYIKEGKIIVVSSLEQYVDLTEDIKKIILPDSFIF